MDANGSLRAELEQQLQGQRTGVQAVDQERAARLQRAYEKWQAKPRRIPNAELTEAITGLLPLQSTAHWSSLMDCARALQAWHEMLQVKVLGEPSARTASNKSFRKKVFAVKVKAQGAKQKSITSRSFDIILDGLKTMKDYYENPEAVDDLMAPVADGKANEDAMQAVFGLYTTICITFQWLLEAALNTLQLVARGYELHTMDVCDCFTGKALWQLWVQLDMSWWQEAQRRDELFEDQRSAFWNAKLACATAWQVLKAFQAAFVVTTDTGKQTDRVRAAVVLQWRKSLRPTANNNDMLTLRAHNTLFSALRRVSKDCSSNGMDLMAHGPLDVPTFVQALPKGVAVSTQRQRERVQAVLLRQQASPTAVSALLTPSSKASSSPASSTNQTQLSSLQSQQLRTQVQSQACSSDNDNAFYSAIDSSNAESNGTFYDAVDSNNTNSDGDDHKLNSTTAYDVQLGCSHQRLGMGDLRTPVAYSRVLAEADLAGMYDLDTLLGPTIMDGSEVVPFITPRGILIILHPDDPTLHASIFPPTNTSGFHVTIERMDGSKRHYYMDEHARLKLATHTRSKTDRARATRSRAVDDRMHAFMLQVQQHLQNSRL